MLLGFVGCMKKVLWLVASIRLRSRRHADQCHLLHWRSTSFGCFLKECDHGCTVSRGCARVFHRVIKKFHDFFVIVERECQSSGVDSVKNLVERNFSEKQNSILMFRKRLDFQVEIFHVLRDLSGKHFIEVFEMPVQLIARNFEAVFFFGQFDNFVERVRRPPFMNFFQNTTITNNAIRSAKW